MQQIEDIALIGMPGAYKSTIGKLLAPQMNRMCVDCDDYLEFEMGMSIPAIIEKFGIDIFRAQESKILKQALSLENIVVSTGGGVVLNENNMRLLKSRCKVVYLYATPKTLFNRVKKHSDRPLLNPNTLETMTKLFEERKALYEKFADITLNTNNCTSARAVEQLLRLL